MIPDDSPKGWILEPLRPKRVQGQKLWNFVTSIVGSHEFPYPTLIILFILFFFEKTTPFIPEYSNLGPD